MSNIQTYLQKILSARYGKDVRQSIHDAIEEVDKVADTAQGSATEAAESAAESARTASEYESNAEQYKNEAKNFRDEAEVFANETVNQIEEEISALTETVNQNAEEISTLTETVELNDKKAYMYAFEIVTNKIVNNLLATEPGYILDATQGKKLNDKIEAMPKIIFATSEPATVEANTVVMVYEE